MKKKKKTKKQKGTKKILSTTQPENKTLEQKQLLVISSKEIFQPVQLTYTTSDIQGLNLNFSKMKCMDNDMDNKRWVWLNIQEAKKVLADSIDKKDPVVLGECYRINEKKLHLNTRSIQRALAAIEFFDRHIPKALFYLTHLTIINRFFDSTEMAKVYDLKGLFESTPLTERNPEKHLARFKKAMAENAKKSHPMNAMDMLFGMIGGEDEPEMEKIPAHFYEDGLEPIRTKLKIRQQVAMEHWKGNTAFKAHQAIDQALKKALRP